jgi:hypothetical protein
MRGSLRRRLRADLGRRLAAVAAVLAVRALLR